MKVRIVVEFDVNFDTDGEELDYDQLRFNATETLRGYVEEMVYVEENLNDLVEALSNNTDFCVSELVTVVIAE